MANFKTKWICTKKLHLGTIKSETNIGTIIEHDPENYWMFVDGRKYENDFDYRLLQKKGWLLQYNEENLQKVRNMADGVRLSIIDAEIAHAKNLKMHIVSGDENIIKSLNGEDVEPIEAVKPVESVKPVEVIKPVEADKTVEVVKTVEAVKPVEAAKTVNKMEVIRSEDFTDDDLNPPEVSRSATMVIRNEHDLKRIDAAPKRGRGIKRNSANENKPMGISNGDEGVGQVMGRVDQFINTNSDNAIKATVRGTSD